MSQEFADIDVMFIAGFGPITQSTSQSRDFYCQALGLPLKPMPGNEAYLLSEQDAIGGVKHFCAVAAGAGGAVLFWSGAVAGDGAGAAGVD